MTLFRPCIDLHEGVVKQIVGGSLRDGETPRTNFSSDRGAAAYAELYRDLGLTGGHVIMLGPGNDVAAREALAAWPRGLQVGGGVNASNAQAWLDAGASHVIVTSWLFPGARLDLDRLKQLADAVGPQHLVLDLSCRRHDGGWFVATDRWQTLTPVRIDPALFTLLDPFCAEYLIHAADVEGLRQGPDWQLAAHLTGITPHPVTYAGGASSLADLDRMHRETSGHLDLTISSALDIFGGTEILLTDCVAFNRRQRSAT